MYSFKNLLSPPGITADMANQKAEYHSGSQGVQRELENSASGYEKHFIVCKDVGVQRSGARNLPGERQQGQQVRFEQSLERCKDNAQADKSERKHYSQNPARSKKGHNMARKLG